MNFKQAWPARLVAVGTMAYSVTMTLAPKLLAKPLGLTTLGKVPADTANLIRSIGTRDVALAAALFAAPAGYPVRLLTVARVVSDAADAWWLGSVVKERSTRTKVAGVALGWALLEGVVGLAPLGRGRALAR